MEVTEHADGNVELAPPIRSVAFVSNKARAGVTTLVAMTAMAAFYETGCTVGVIDAPDHGWLQRWRTQAMWSPERGLDMEWEHDDLRGPLVRPLCDERRIGDTMWRCYDIGCEVGLIDAGVATGGLLAEVLAAADFVVVVLGPHDEVGLAGGGAEAALVAAGKPGAVILNDVREGVPEGEAAVAALRSRAGLPLLAVVPHTDLVAAVLPRCLNHIEYGANDEGTLAVAGIWRGLEARVPGLVLQNWQDA